MENKCYKIGNTDYEIYQAASGDYCVAVDEHGEYNYYNCGTYEKALEFILADYEIEA